VTDSQVQAYDPSRLIDPTLWNRDASNVRCKRTASAIRRTNHIHHKLSEPFSLSQMVRSCRRLAIVDMHHGFGSSASPPTSAVSLCVARPVEASMTPWCKQSRRKGLRTDVVSYSGTDGERPHVLVLWLRESCNRDVSDLVSGLPSKRTRPEYSKPCY
jgi:hypothetical protein